MKTNWSEKAFALFQTGATISAIYICVIGIIFRRKIVKVIDRFQGIYDSSEIKQQL